MEGKKCANCGIEIRWAATIVEGLEYCCTGCSRGGPCTCDYLHLPEEGSKAELVCSSRRYWHMIVRKVARKERDDEQNSRD